MRRNAPAVQAAKARLPGRRSLGASAVSARVRPSGTEAAPAAVGKNGLPTGVGAEQAFKHRARDAFATGGLAAIDRTSTGLDVARRRGPRVRSGPLASCAPSAFFGVAVWNEGAPGAF